MPLPKSSKPSGEARVRIDVNQCMAKLKQAGKKCLKVYGYSGGSEKAARSVDCYQLAVEYPSGMIENFRRLFPFIETPTYLLIQASKKEKCKNGECLPHLEFFVYGITIGERPAPYGYIQHETSGEVVDLISGSRLIESSLLLIPTDASDEQLLEGVLNYIGGKCPQIRDWKVERNYTPRSDALKPPEVQGTYKDYLERTREEE